MSPAETNDSSVQDANNTNVSKLFGAVTGDVLPVLQLRDNVMLPQTVIPVLVGRERSKVLIKSLIDSEQDHLVLTGARADIEVPGPADVYPTNNKVEIARRYLVPKQAEEHGLESDQFVVTDDALEDVAGSYTREAGVRGLDRVIAKLARKTVRRLVEEEETAVIDRDDLGDLLGPIPFRAKSAEAADAVGVTTGLAVTGVGGDVLFVEAALVEGSGKLTLTGQLGDVMRESAQAVATYARSRVAQNPSGSVAELDGWFDRTDVHLHVPDGAVLKDGPSAGVTMTTSLVSALTSTPVRANVAMTGEVPLRGNVLPIGGVKDKVLAAHLAGIDTVLLPADNAKDLVDIPEEIREQMDIRLVAHMDEVLEYALAT